MVAPGMAPLAREDPAPAPPEEDEDVSRILQGQRELQLRIEAWDAWDEPQPLPLPLPFDPRW